VQDQAVPVQESQLAVVLVEQDSNGISKKEKKD
jgi:hypothetical protein